MYTCGACLGDVRAYRARNTIPNHDEELQRIIESSKVKGRTDANQHDNDGSQQGDDNYTVVHTGGSTIEPQSDTLARSGCAVYVDKDSPNNCYGPLVGPAPNTHRAELMVVVQATGIVKGPIWIKSDCKSVVDTAMATIHGEEQAIEAIGNDKIAEANLWQDLHMILLNRKTRRENA